MQLLQSEISKDPLCGSQNILDSSCCKDVTKLLKDIVASFPSTDKSSIQSKEEDTSQPVQLALDEALKGTLGRCGWDSENASFNSENQPSVRKLIYELSNYVAYGSARSDNVTNCNSFLSFLPDALLQRVAVTSAAIVSPQAVQSSKKSDISDNAYQELKQSTVLIVLCSLIKNAPTLVGLQLCVWWFMCTAWTGPVASTWYRALWVPMQC